MNNILEKLDKLNDQEIKKVVKLIEKLAAKHEKRANPPKSKETNKRQPEIAQAKKQRSLSESVRSEHGLRQQPEQPHRQSRRGNKVKTGKGEKLCRRQPFEIKERKNQFLEMPEFHMEKKDSEIDRKLAGPISPRMASRNVWVECNECGGDFHVNPNLVYRSEEGVQYKCPECSGR